MRLLCVADIHYALPQYDWLLEMAPRFDLVIVAGDFLDVSSPVDLRAQAVVVQKYIARLKDRTRLIICSGNHDLDSRDDAGEKVARWMRNVRHFGVPGDGESFVLGDTLFTVCPWWDGPVVRKAIGAQLAADAAKRNGRWVWVHHAPPAASPVSWAGARSYGDPELVQWIGQYRPDIIFSGHVHQAPFIKDGSWVDRIDGTWVFNSGHQFGAPPSHVVVDTDTETAFWFSAAGNQTVRLDRPLERPVARLGDPPAWLTSADPSEGRIPASLSAPAGG